MSAADELERMAEELEKLEDAQEFGPMFERGVAEGLRRARIRLEERAAELRAASPTVWSGANGSVSVGADGALEFRRPDGSKIWDFGEGLPLLIDCTVALLRERAASAPVVNLPKPERVELCQLWQQDGGAVEAVTALIDDAERGITLVHFDGQADAAAIARVMLRSSRYRYLGDGERPNIGGSEVQEGAHR